MVRFLKHRSVLPPFEVEYIGQDFHSNNNYQTRLNSPQAGQNKSQMMVKTMDAYGLGVAATLNGSTKMVFQSRNLMMRIDYVDQNSTVQTTELVLYQYNAITAPSMGLVDRAGPVTGTKQYFLGLT